MSKIRIQIELLLMTTWVGCLLCCGYITAPVLFAYLPEITAGDLAGELFHIVAYIGIITAPGLILSGYLNEKKSFIKSSRFIWLMCAFISVFINEYLITPVIVAHKTHTENWLLSWTGGSFGIWHGLSQSVYLLTTICALMFAMLWVRYWGRQ